MVETPAAASLSLEEAAAFLGVHPVTLQAMAKSGQVRGAKIGRAWRFLDVDLVTHVRANYASSNNHTQPHLRHVQPHQQPQTAAL